MVKSDNNVDKRILENMKLVSNIARNYARLTGIKQEELEGYGYEGLVIAANKYIPDYDISFSKYAAKSIRWSILNGIVKETNSKSNNFYYDYVNAKKVVEKKYGVSLSDNPELLEEVIETMIETGKINKTEKSIKEARRILTYFAIGNESLDDEETVESLTESGELVDKFDYATIAENKTLREEIEKIIDTTLTPRNAQIMKWKYGFFDGKTHTGEEIAKKLNVSPQAISDIENRSLEKLKKACRKHPIKDYLEDAEIQKYGR